MTTFSRLLGVLSLEIYRVSKSAFKSHMTIIQPHHGILYCVDSKLFVLIEIIASSLSILQQIRIWLPIALKDLCIIRIYSEEKKYKNNTKNEFEFQRAFENKMYWVNIYLKP